MNKILLTICLSFLTTYSAFAQNAYASELIIVNGESFGANQSNIASYNIATKAYFVFDSILDSSVQDILIEDSVAYVASENKILSYNLITKTKIAEAFYPGESPAKGSLFLDANKLFVGNWFGQTDDNLYAFDKSTLNFEYAVNEASVECGGGLSLNDTLYIGQKIKGTVDACAPYGCYSDSIGAIVVSNATTGAYYRTIDLGTAGSGISQIYNNGNFIFAVCPESDKVLKIEIGTDNITEEISLAPFSTILNQIGSKIYLDLNGNAGYFDMADDSFAMSSLAISGVAVTYDPSTEKAFSTSTDYFSFGKLSAYTLNNGDTIEIGISPEAIALYYVNNTAPIAVNDSFTFVYDELVAEYTLDVLLNDTDPEGDALTVSNLSATSVNGASIAIVDNKIVYTRSAGIATTDVFTYDACDDNGLCSTAQVKVTLKSVTNINDIALQSNVVVYPNPTNGWINIASENDITEVNIYSISGQKVKSSIVSKINVQDLNKGLYFVEVKTNNTTVVQSITVQ